VGDPRAAVAAVVVVAASDADASALVVRRAIVGQVDAALGVDAGHLVAQAVVDRALVVVLRELVFVELRVLRDREFVVIGRDARPREIVHA